MFSSTENSFYISAIDRRTKETVVEINPESQRGLSGLSILVL